MFLKITRKVLNADNTIEMKAILLEMEYVDDESTQEERTVVFYDTLRKGVEILTKDNTILLGGQEEVVDAKMSDDEEYNLMVKSNSQGMDIDKDNIYLL